MSKPRIYIASKTKHPLMWRGLRQAMNIISTWIDEAGEGETADFSDLWHRCINEATTADALIAYHEVGDVWKGGLHRDRRRARGQGAGVRRRRPAGDVGQACARDPMHVAG